MAVTHSNMPTNQHCQVLQLGLRIGGNTCLLLSNIPLYIRLLHHTESHTSAPIHTWSEFSPQHPSHIKVSWYVELSRGELNSSEHINIEDLLIWLPSSRVRWQPGVNHSSLTDLCLVFLCSVF